MVRTTVLGVDLLWILTGVCTILLAFGIWSTTKIYSHDTSIEKSCVRIEEATKDVDSADRRSLMIENKIDDRFKVIDAKMDKMLDILISHERETRKK